MRKKKISVLREDYKDNIIKVLKRRNGRLLDEIKNMNVRISDLKEVTKTFLDKCNCNKK